VNALQRLISHPIAHRGLHDGNQNVPENSIAAFQLAARAGYGIELDVQLSADNVAMVFHDADLSRLCARPERIGDLSSDVLRRVRLCDTAQTIPTLNAVLSSVGLSAPIVVEMKDNGSRNETLANAVVRELIASTGDHCAMSFSYDLVTHFIAASAHVPCGLTAQGKTDEALEAHERMLAGKAGDQIRFISYNVHDLPNRFVESLRRADRPAITWTVKDDATRRHSELYADQITFEGFLP